MRQYLIAGNWKMNLGPVKGVELVKNLKEELGQRPFDTEILICPPFLAFGTAKKEAEGTAINVGAQNLHFESDGAYTGEISSTMLQEAGCQYVIIGHSERREYFGETDEIIAKKVKKAIESGLKPIFCVGEKLSDRKAGNQETVVMEQIRSVIQHLTEEDADKLTIAYEPVWAIGTGETATPEQAQEMHQFIRNLLTEFWSTQRLASIRILYGGSMKPGNARELLQQPDVDGGLIGGASLDASAFAAIVDTAEQLGQS